MVRTDYVANTMNLRNEMKRLGVGDPVEYVSRPGGGDPPKWHFVGGYQANGGHAAESYLRGLLAGIKLATGRED